MKFIAVFLIAFVVFVSAEDGPTKISDNNVGDIINVGIKANAKIDNKIDATLIQVLLDVLNKQKIQIGGGNGNDYPNFPNLPQLPQLPEFPPIEFPPIRN